MKVIEYIKLYNYLVDIEKLEKYQVLRNILRIRKLPKDLQEAVLIITNHPEAYPNISVEGVTFEELVDKDGMKKIRAILMLDWIRREPEAAISYMAENAMRAPIQPLDQEELAELEIAIERLKTQVKVQPQEEPEVDKSEDDIVIQDTVTDDSSNSALQNGDSEEEKSGDSSIIEEITANKN